ncbi:hypothetical protein HGRIS_006980 [Hohenbuehelia grisea]|uniref:Altered inheritance of mitochondria protein 9, mitochondrial n=1 Tax=Hohenbuehelia grisea TaxID=104357 RepID=A0ABR3JBU4_9AGAR
MRLNVGVLLFPCLLADVRSKKERSIRRVEFDPEALQKIGCAALGAKECVEFTSLSEGSYNRVFRLSFDNGTQATAKIPYPVPGHTPRRISSEVATLQYIKDTTMIPVPSILAWSALKHATPVGSEFILLKHFPGVMLAARWDEPGLDELAVFWPVLLYEREFQKASFSGIGSLYFKDDVSSDLQQRPLFVGDVPPKYEAVKDKYRIGPLADRHYWRGPRGDGMYDNGPWPNILSYFIAVAQNQLLFLRHHAKDDAPFRRQPFHSRDVHEATIRTYIETIPLILPPEEAQTPMLWHPDLNAQNIIVDPDDRPVIHSVIDWQDTAILPFFMQGTPPPLVMLDSDEFGFQPKDGIREPDPFPEDPVAHGIDPKFISLAQREWERVRRKMWYIGKLLNQEHRSPVLTIPHTDIIGMLPFNILRSWEDGIFPVRKALHDIHDNWEDLAQPGVPRPAALVSFAQDRASTEAEDKKWAKWMSHSEIALDWIAGQGDGRLSQNEDVARQTITLAPQLKDQWDTDDDFPDPYPFADGQYSFFLT